MTSPTNQRQRDKADTRQRIIDAGLELFREHGYDNTSMAQIAQAAGTSRANLYLHFSNKPMLVKARMTQLRPLVLAHFRKLSTLPDHSPESLRRWLIEDRRTHIDHRADFEAITAAVASDDEVFREWIRMHERAAAEQEWIEELFPDPEERAIRRAQFTSLMLSTERIFDIAYLRQHDAFDEHLMLTALSRQWSALFTK